MRDNQTFMWQQSETPACALDVLTNKSTSLTKPTIEFPTWDGSTDTIPDFIFGINVIKNDVFFKNVQSWSHFMAGDEKQNKYLLTSITTKVPLHKRSIFANDCRYTTDGFAMLSCLLTHLKEETTENKLIAVAELVVFNFKPTDTTATYCARMRRLRTILSTITLDEIISLITLGKAEPSLYPRIRSLFLQGDPTLLSEDLLAIERRMEREDRIRMLMGKTPDTAGRTTAPHQQEKPASAGDSTFKYPSTTDRPLSWNLVKRLTKDTTTCPGCFATGEFGKRCRDGVCMVLAGSGFVLKYDPEAAQRLVNAHRSLRKGRGSKGARWATDKDGADPQEAPEPTPDQRTAADVVAGVKRATSVDKVRQVSTATGVQATKEQPLSHSDGYYDSMAYFLLCNLCPSLQNFTIPFHSRQPIS